LHLSSRLQEKPAGAMRLLERDHLKAVNRCRTHRNLRENRKPAELPLPGEVGDLLRGYLAGKPANSTVWPGTWSNAASAKMIRLDLAEQSMAWRRTGYPPASREQSDFLAYVDAEGRHADFHRFGTCTSLGLSEAALRPRLPRSWRGMATFG
jgi:hypothetical protein